LQVASNGDEKHPLFSCIVESNHGVFIFDERGDKKTVLEGHTTPLKCHAWCSSDTVISVAVDGEARLWTIRGSRVDCTKIKDAAQDVSAVAGLPPKKGVQRFVAWRGGNIIDLFEGAKAACPAKRFDGTILAITTRGDEILVLEQTGQDLCIHVFDDRLAPKNSIELAPVEGKVIDALISSPSGTGDGAFILLDDGSMSGSGDSVSSVTSKVFNSPATSMWLDNESGTLFAGLKDGRVESVAIKAPFSFGKSLGAIEAQDFKITALGASRTALVLVTGGLDGLVAFHEIPATLFKPLAKIVQSAGDAWKAQERVDAKIKMAETFASKGQVKRARQVVETLKTNTSAVDGSKIQDLEARVSDLAKQKEDQKAIKNRLIEYLRMVAEDRGDITIDEIAGSLELSKEDVKTIVRDVAASMEWEYVEAYDVLFLFDRAATIVAKSALETAITNDTSGSRPAYHGSSGTRNRNYRQEREDHRPSRQQRQPRQQPSYNQEGSRNEPRQKRYERERPSQPTTPQQSRPPVQRGNVPPSRTSHDLLAKLIPSVKDQMNAELVGADGQILEMTSLAELTGAVEKQAGSVKYILMDGIISPRLVEIAEKSGVATILGRRLHPNVDKTKTRVDCIEFDRFSSFVATPAREQRRGPERRALDQGAEQDSIERMLLSVLDAVKWKNLNQLLLEARIDDPLNKEIARINMKQLAATGTVEVETHRGEPFYRKSAKQK